MTERFKQFVAERLALQPAMQAAHDRANREAILGHARAGRSVPMSRDGKVVWISPAEVFANYGLDPCGCPLPDPRFDPEYYI